MFPASKAFALADAIIKIQKGIAAAANPGPLNIAAMASVVPAWRASSPPSAAPTTAARAQYGSPANADNMYRVNETPPRDVLRLQCPAIHAAHEVRAGDSGRSDGLWQCRVENHHRQRPGRNDCNG